MSTATYARYEVLRTFRNRRFFIFSLVFPLTMYLLIAGPNRDETDLGGTGISAPLYFMVGLVGFGTMVAVIGGRRPDRRRAHRRLEPPAAPDARCGPRATCAPRCSPAT